MVQVPVPARPGRSPGADREMSVEAGILTDMRISAWLRRWQERRVTRAVNRAWLRQTAGDQEVFEAYFDYGDIGDGITVMTAKQAPSKEREQ